MKCSLRSVVIGLTAVISACHPSTTAIKNKTETREIDTPIKQVRVDPIVYEKPKSNAIDTVKLDHGFQILYYWSDTQLVDFLRIFHNGKEIDLPKNDSITYAYLKEFKLYPAVNKINDQIFEIMVAVDDRPLLEKASLFRIEDDKLVFRKGLPMFFAKASDLTGDGTLEYAGMWDSSEEFDQNGVRYRTYDPVVYYKLTSDGLKLDTPLTIRKNTMLYGKFMGYRYDGKAAAKISNGCNERILEEIKRIQNNAKK